MAKKKVKAQETAPVPAVVAVQRKAVNIVAMGSSRDDWVAASLVEDRPPIIGPNVETWCINYMGGIVYCDRIVHVDPVHAFMDVPIVKTMCDRALERNIPFYTSAPHPNYKNHALYPFHKISAALGGQTYFNTTVAYAFAMAFVEGYNEIGLWGCDFSYPDIHIAESGRACVEYWIGIASSRGVRVAVSAHSTLMDMKVKQQPYGFFVDPNVPPAKGGRIMTPEEMRQYCEMYERGETWVPKKDVKPPQYMPGVMLSGMEHQPVTDHKKLQQDLAERGINLSPKKDDSIDMMPPPKPNGEDHAPSGLYDTRSGS